MRIHIEKKTVQSKVKFVESMLLEQRLKANENTYWKDNGTKYAQIRSINALWSKDWKLYLLNGRGYHVYMQQNYLTASRMV
jgi:hypothetical protein